MYGEEDSGRQALIFKENFVITAILVLLGLAVFTGYILYQGVRFIIS